MNNAARKKVVACVIVRMKSTRLPLKALLEISGCSMLEQLVRRLRTSKYITDIVICTSTHEDDQILLEKAEEFGVHSYAGHERDVLSRLMDVAEIYDADMVLRITGDNPFTDAENIDRMVEHHIETSADYTRTNRLPLGVTAEVMSTGMLPKLRDIIPDLNQSGYLSFFSFNPDVFHCEVLEPLPGQDRPYYSLTIDYPEDLELARTLYSKCGKNGEVPSLQVIINELDNDESYESVAGDTEIKLPGGETMSYDELIQMLDEKAAQARAVAPRE